jgi:hypothetical protein
MINLFLFLITCDNTELGFNLLKPELWLVGIQGATITSL